MFKNPLHAKCEVCKETSVTLNADIVRSVVCTPNPICLPCVDACGMSSSQGFLCGICRKRHPVEKMSPVGIDRIPVPMNVYGSDCWHLFVICCACEQVSAAVHPASARPAAPMDLENQEDAMGLWLRGCIDGAKRKFTCSQCSQTKSMAQCDKQASMRGSAAMFGVPEEEIPMDETLPSRERLTDSLVERGLICLDCSKSA